MYPKYNWGLIEGLGVDVNIFTHIGVTYSLGPCQRSQNSEMGNIRYSPLSSEALSITSRSRVPF